MIHFFQAHGLRAKLDVVFRLFPHRTMLVFHGIQANREICRRDAAPRFATLRLDAIALAPENTKKTPKSLYFQGFLAFLSFICRLFVA